MNNNTDKGLQGNEKIEEAIAGLQKETTQEMLAQAKHNYELEESDSTVLCIDYALNGIGSNSCGPEVLAAYRFDEKEFQFGFTLVPYVKG